MQFKITRHAVGRPPENALDLLAEQLGKRREGVTFSRVGSSITARMDQDDPISMTQDERAERGRDVLLAMIAEVCEDSPGMKFDWYAVRAVG